ncbi:hypothetical protein ACLOAV_003221 [Pseudogymnoascus australis]
MLFRRSTQERERRGRAARSAEEEEFAAEGGDESFLDFCTYCDSQLPLPEPKHPLLLRTLPPARPPRLLTHNILPLLPTTLALPPANNLLPPPPPHLPRHNRHPRKGHHPAPLPHALLAESLHPSYRLGEPEVDKLRHRAEGGEGADQPPESEEDSDGGVVWAYRGKSSKGYFGVVSSPGQERPLPSRAGGRTRSVDLITPVGGF